MPEIIKSKKEVTEETTEELEYINFVFFLHLKMPKPNREAKQRTEKCICNIYHGE